MSKRLELKKEAEEKLDKLKEEYISKKTSKQLDDYKSEAKAKYLANLSNEYYKKADQFREEYRKKIFDAGMLEVEELKSKQKTKSVLDSFKKKTTEELLAENNQLMYATYILSNGSVAQINKVLGDNEDNLQIRELIKAKINSLSDVERGNFGEMANKIATLEVDKAAELEKIIRIDDFNYSTDYPATLFWKKDLKKMFEVEESNLAQFFAQ